MGVTGVNWNVKIMPIQGSGPISDIIEAYGYVLDARTLYNQTNGSEGAFVVATNSSFGIDGGDPGGSGPIDINNYSALCAMYDDLGIQGVLNITSCGNRSQYR